MRRDEHRLQNALLVALSKIEGCVAWRNVVGTFRAYSNPEQIVKVGTPGQADVFACFQGRFFSMELKAKRGRRGHKQEAWARTVERCGGTHIWVELAGSADMDIADAVVRTINLITKMGPAGANQQGPSPS